MISIIVPVYNIEAYIGKCIESIMDQTYRNLDIILINDCSTDDSGKICDEYARKDSRIRVIHHEKNMGLSAARNTGIDAMSIESQYCMFVDGDDYIEPELCEKALASLQMDSTVDTAHWGYKTVDEGGTTLGTFEPILYPQIRIQGEDIFNQFINTLVVSLEDLQNWFISQKSYYDAVHSKKQMATVWRYLYSVDVIKSNHLFFDLHAGRGEDIVFNLQYLQCCKGIINIPDTFYLYRQRPGSLIQDNKSITKKIELIEAMERTTDFAPIDKKEELRNKWRGQRILVVMNTARGLAKNASFFRGYRQFLLVAKHPINVDAYGKLQLRNAPFKYKIAMGMIKYKMYFLFYLSIYLMKLLHIDLAPMG